ncbi:hypothetical protein N9Y92_02280 [Chlamydiales bacterium]|nr:hypothetical protein [Chlamydiales bacterium]
MDEDLKVYADRLREGKVEEIDIQIPSSFMEVNEKDLSFQGKVSVRGQAYVVNDELVLNLHIFAEAIMPCQICNELTCLPLELKGVYGVFAISEIKGKVFNCSSFIREEILIALPQFIECHKGKCPERVLVKKYLTSKREEGEGVDEGYHPFKDLT